MSVNDNGRYNVGPHVDECGNRCSQSSSSKQISGRCANPAGGISEAPDIKNSNRLRSIRNDTLSNVANRPSVYKRDVNDKEAL